MNKWNINTKYILQLFLFISINAMFILKYAPRYSLNPYLILTGYCIAIYALLYLYKKYNALGSEKLFRFFYWIFIILVITGITGLLIMINPYSIRVDRWSALTFFWDSVFKGQYPYGTHTHISSTNFASPFPLWHLISLPFYLLKDVGIELIFFLLILALTLKRYFISYRKSLFFLLLLCSSPCYWWEISARSDSLSNGLLVFILILWYHKNNYSLSNNFYLTILLCGSIAATRMTAIIPLALFFLQPYLQLSVRQKIMFPLMVLIIATFYFLPFIFWDTKTWIFFSRNPFMSQTANGNIYVLIFMLIIGIILAIRWKKITDYFGFTAIFITIFILLAQLVRIYNAGEGTLFSDAISDISYFNLALPYCIYFLTSELNLTKTVNKIN